MLSNRRVFKVALTVAMLSALASAKRLPPCPARNPCGPDWWSGNMSACCTGNRTSDPKCCYQGHAYVPNQLGQTPPRGWRTFNAFRLDVNQSLLEDIMRGLTKKRSFGGHNATHEPLSLADFGYVDVGLDAGYVASGTGYDGTCHTKSGHLLIDETKFPSLKSMTSMAHSLNLTASWYLNLDGGCNGSKEVEVGPTYTTDSADAVTYGFDGVKFDSEPGGPSHNITLWAMALTSAAKAAGKSEGMMIENCQDKNPTYLLDDPTDCPYNFYRTGPDNSPSFFGLIYHVFNYAVPYLQVTDPVPASRPHCWAYPDGLGIGSPVKGTTSWAAARANGCANMTIAEERTLFANWAIVSSPIILSIDARDDAEVEKYWPIVTNRRALQINDGWAGSAGSLLKQSAQTTNRSTPVGASCNNIHIYKDIPNWLLYVKPLPGGEVAALAINSGERALAATDNVALTLDELIAIVAKASVGVWPTSTPPTTFTAVDVWSGAALPIVTATNPWSAVGQGPHDSAFVLFTPA